MSLETSIISLKDILGIHVQDHSLVSKALSAASRTISKDGLRESRSDGNRVLAAVGRPLMTLIIALECFAQNMDAGSSRSTAHSHVSCADQV